MSKKYKESKGYKGAVQKISYWQLINTYYGGNLTRNDSSMKKVYLNNITKVIFNNPATIVFWRDGTKTVVKSNPGDVFDPEKGLAMACTKKLFGNNGFYYDIFRKWLPEEEEESLYPKFPDSVVDAIRFSVASTVANSIFKNEVKQAASREADKFYNKLVYGTEEGPAKKVNFKDVPSTMRDEFEKLAELAKENEDK